MMPESTAGGRAQRRPTLTSNLEGGRPVHGVPVPEFSTVTSRDLPRPFAFESIEPDGPPVLNWMIGPVWR